MKLTPEYAENIIVAIMYNGKLSWYVADKEIWYMDYKKRIIQFEESGYSINLEYIDDLRKDLLILDGTTITTFEKRLIDFKVSTDELNRFLMKEKEKNKEWYYDLSPSLYINFDSKILYSAYREMTSYERYVPDDWKGEYRDILEYIPTKEKYWLDENGKNCFE